MTGATLHSEKGPTRRRLTLAYLTRSQVPERVPPGTVREHEHLGRIAGHRVSASLLLELQSVILKYDDHRAVLMDAGVVELEAHELAP
jgi:hypothetical protein